MKRPQTADKQELQRLRTLVSQYEDLLRCLPVGLIFIDDQDRVAMANPIGRQIRCVGDRVGGPVADCHPNSAHATLGKVMERFRTLPTEQQHPIVVERNERYEVTYSRVSDPAGDYRGVLWLAQDISRRKQLEQQLLHAQRLAGLGSMAAKIAHDIRNPLNAIQGAAHYMQQEAEDDEAQELTQLIKEQVSRVAALLSRLNALTRPLQPHFEPTDLPALVQAQLRASSLAHPRVKCTVEAAPDLPPVPCDVALVERLVGNAAENSLAAMAAASLNQIDQSSPEAGGDPGTIESLRVLESAALEVTIGLQTEQDGAWVLISFQDTGPGFPAEVLDNLGQPFVTTRPDGIGLGMTIMREICLLHGGDLTVQNNQRGALVTARLSAR